MKVIQTAVLAMAGSVMAATLFLGAAVSAAPFVDDVTHMRVTPPDGWDVASGEHLGDRVALFKSPDGRAQILIRQVRLKAGVQAQQLLENYNQSLEGQANFIGSAPETLGGIEGLVGVWTVEPDGVKRVLGVYFGIRDRLGLIVETRTLAEAYRQFSPVYDKVFASFAPGRLPDRHSPPAKPEPEFVIHPYPALGFAIGALPGWTLEQPEAYSIRLRSEAEHPLPGGSITIEAWDASAYGTLDAFFEDVKAALSAADGARMREIPVSSDQALQYDGRPLRTRALIAEYGSDKVMRTLAYMAERRHPGVLYGIFVTAPRAAWDDRQADISFMLDSFALIPLEAQ